jgi:hypothetical protein
MDWSILRTNPHARLVREKAPNAEEKGGEAPRLSFAENVKALSQHGRSKIDGYLPKCAVEEMSKNDQRDTLIEAIYNNDRKAVAILADCGVDINMTSWGAQFTPLILCCQSGYPKIVELLLVKGANPNILPEGGSRWSALHWCAPVDQIRTGKTKDFLHCAKLLLDHGADVNLKTIIEKNTPLHLIGRRTPPEFAVLLLSRGADPLARNAEQKRPSLKPKHFQGLGKHLPEALEQGKQSQVKRWITAVEKLLPDLEAASLLVEWADLCRSDADLSEQIHKAIAGYLTYLNELKADPPPDIAAYVERYNAQYEFAECNRIADKLTNDGLALIGKGAGFHVVGENFSAETHCPLLIELACLWALHREENRMDFVVGILTFAAKAARDQQVPQDVRDKLYADVKELRNQLKKSTDPELAGRVEAIDRFLNPFN